MHGHTNTDSGLGENAHRFNVAMCEMARATQQHTPRMNHWREKQRKVMVEQAHHVHLILTHGDYEHKRQKNLR